VGLYGALAVPVSCQCTAVVILGNAGPGGVGNSTNNKLWLKANDLNQANGTGSYQLARCIGQWTDSPANIPLTPANQPTFNTKLG